MKVTNVLALLASLSSVTTVAAIPKVTKSGNLRNVDSAAKGNQLSSHDDRMLQEDEVVTFLLADVQFEDHATKLDDIMNVEFEGGYIYELTNIDPSWKAENADVLKSGMSQLRIPGGRLANGKLDVGGGKPEIVGQGGNGRKLSVATGNKSVLIVRVIANNGATSFTEEQLSDSVFGDLGDPVNLKSQYEACSYNKITINKPAAVPSGATTVTVAVDTTQGDVTMRNAISAQLNSMYGVTSPSQIANNVMYCLPTGTMGGIAYAFINSWMSVYSNQWCTYVSAQIHELGHNFNLAHSNEAPTTYADQSGMMGYSYSQSNSPVMCFNAAKSWQLGWYDDRKLTFSTTDSSWSGKLIGIADYATSTSIDGPILIKLNTDTSTDLYLNFNRRTGINSGTVEGGDQVMLVQTGLEGSGYSESNLEAKLGAGSSFTIQNFSGSLMDLTITVKAIVISSPFSYADIQIDLGGSPCVTDADCSSLTQDACNVGTCGLDNKCTLVSVENCCLGDAECPDQNACNVGTCLADNTCGFAAVANCCLEDSECAYLNQDACNVGSCGVDNTCGVAVVENCCLDDFDCDDSVFCTADTCDLNTNLCSNVPVADCTCGNGTCDVGENCNNCSIDCASGNTASAFCGNGICEGANGESTDNCPADCPGKTNGKPSDRWCCGEGCGCSDVRCTSGGFQCTENQVISVFYCCGDNTCSGDETAATCSIDCLSP